MTELLFHTPWWLPTLLIGAGVILFWTGNQRQETRVRLAGMLLVLAAAVLCTVSYLVDTDIISAHLRGSGAVTNRFLQYSGRLHVSVVTLAELKVWVLSTRHSRLSGRGEQG